MLAILAALYVQSSLLVKPLALGAEPPSSRAVAAVRISTPLAPSPDSALEIAAELRESVLANGTFLAAARALAASPSGGAAAIVGTFPRGMLAPAVEQHLDSAEPGALSEPIRDGDAFWLVQSLERDAACRQVFVRGTEAQARNRVEAILRELRAGADFARIARERSDDRPSALRGGALAIYERGAQDALLRQAAFECRLGEIAGPIESPLGFHVLQRVDVADVDPRLRDDSWVHARGILIAFTGAEGSHPALEREHDEAQRLADDLAARIVRGADMAELARAFDDDRGGRERGGDLGWVRRRTTIMPAFFDKLFTEPPGALIGPIASNAGFVLLRREDLGPRSRIDLRKREFLDLEQWVRAVAESNSPPPSIDGLAKAVESARALTASFATPLEWGRLEAGLPQCWSAAEFLARLSERPAPESEAAARSAEATRAFAQALVELEPAFHAEVWPAHERAIDAAMAAVRPTLVELGDVALEILMGDLGIADPRIVVPIHFVAEAPMPGGVTLRGPSGAFVLLDADRFDGSTLLEAILHEASHALDAASAANASVLSDLRARLQAGGAPDRANRDVPHTLLFVESARVVRTVLDAAHRDYGDVCGYYAKVPAALAAVREPWEQLANGSLDRESALARIVELGSKR